MKTDPPPSPSPLTFSYISRNQNHEEISYISGNGRPEKIPFISRSNFSSAKKTPRKRNFLCFTKWNFLALILKKILYFLIFQETNYIFRNPWNRTFFYNAGATSNAPKTKIYFIFPKKLNKFFKEHFRIIFSINYINWIKKYHCYIESHLLRWIFFQLLDKIYYI